MANDLARGTTRSRITYTTYLPLSIALLILAFVAFHIIDNFDNIASHDIHFHVVPVLLSLCCNMLGLLLFSYGWHNTLKYHAVSIDFGTSNTLWLVSSYGKYIPGRIWQFAGRLYLFNRHGIPNAKVLLCSAYEQVYLLASATLVFLVACPFYFERFSSIRLSQYAAIVIVCLGLSVLVLDRRILNMACRYLSRYSTRFALHFDMSFTDSLKLLSLYCLGWSIIGCGLAVLISAFIDIHWHDTVFVMGANAISYVIGVVVLVVPNGLGVREGILTILLKSVTDTGMSALLAIVSRVWYIAAEALYFLVLVVVSKVQHNTFNVLKYTLNRDTR